MSSTAAAAAAEAAAAASACQECEKDLRLAFIVLSDSSLPAPVCQQIDLELCVCVL